MLPAAAGGSTIAHYRIVGKLGEGGMGVVYRAEDTKLQRPVALKLLSPAMTGDMERRRRMENEARSAAKLLHANIATVFELGEAESQLYIAFEYVAGRTLRQWLREEGRKDPLKLARGIARALAFAHQQGVVHRDIKPENVMVTPEGSCKVLDFGLARSESASDSTQSLTDEGQVVGTIGYMSPEQLRGESVDYRSDIFSFGVLLYELVAGSHPFKGANPASTIARILTADPASLPANASGASPELERIVQKCLRKKPSERYQSTQDLVVDLHALTEQGLSLISVAPPVAVAQEVRHLSRKVSVVQVLFLPPSVAGLVYLFTPSNVQLFGSGALVQGLLIAVFGLLIACCVVGPALVASMWRAEHESLTSFKKWFFFYAFVDLVPAIFMFGLASSKLHLAVGVLVFALYVYLPFYQRRVVVRALSRTPFQ